MDSHLRAADYRPGDLPCCGRSLPRERSIFSTKPTRRRLLAAQARPLWPMWVQLLGAHQQTNLWWKVHSSHYYSCLRTTSGFLKQERCSQRRIRADVLDELVWEEVTTRLQDPALVLEAYQDHNTRRRASSDQDGASANDDRLKEQTKLANRE